MHVAGVLRTRRRLAEPSVNVARIKDPITVVLPTIGRDDTFSPCRRVVLSLVESLPQYFDDVRVDVVIEEGASASRALHELAALHSVVRVLTVPTRYRTANGSRFKARANQYALERRTAEGESAPTRWILHMDDDTSVRADTARAMAQCLAANPALYLAQGVLCYPRQYAANRLTWLADAIRTSDDVGRFALLTGSGTPRAGLHGELLLIRASIEAEIGWDFGPREVVEDARFALLFAGRYPGRSGWFAGRSYGSSPESLRDFCRQRARWAEGLLRLVLTRSIPIRDRLVMASGLGSCGVGILQHPGIVFPAMLLTGLNTSPVVRPLILVWAANLARVIWQYWHGLAMNCDASGEPRARLADRVAVVALVPVFAIGEGIGVMVGLARLLTRRPTGFTVIAKTDVAGGYATLWPERAGAPVALTDP